MALDKRELFRRVDAMEPLDLDANTQEKIDLLYETRMLTGATNMTIALIKDEYRNDEMFRLGWEQALASMGEMIKAHTITKYYEFSKVDYYGEEDE